MGAAFFVLGITAPPAGAHAILRASEPANRDVLEVAPEQLVLRFNERVGAPPDAVKVYAGSGDTVDIGPIQVSGDGTVVTADLPPLEDGAYVVSWQIISGDTHPIGSAFLFWVGEGAANEAEVEELLDELLAGRGADEQVGIGYGVARFVAFAGMVLLVGGALFVALVWPGGSASPRLRRMIGAGWLAWLVATIATIGFQAAYGVGGSWGDTFDATLIGDVLGTTAGRAWLVRLGLLAVVALAWRSLMPRPFFPGRSADSDGSGGDDAQAPHIGGVVVLGAALLATVSYAGHASTGDLVPFALVADVIHLGGIAFWLAGLTLLFLVVLRLGPAGVGAPSSAPAKSLSAAALSSADQRERAGEPGGGEDGVTGQMAVRADGGLLHQIVQRFSTLAGVAVVVVVVTGTFLGWRQTRGWSALFDATYGRLLLAKVALVAVILVGGAVSRSTVRKWAARADQPNRSPHTLSRSVGFEALVAGAVLAVTAVLVNTVPAKDAQAGSIFETEVHGSNVVAQVTVDPAETGLVDLDVRILTHDSEPIDPEELELFLSLEEESISRIEVEPEHVDTGHYQATGTEILFSGTWTLEVVAKTSEIDVDRIRVDVPIE